MDEKLTSENMQKSSFLCLCYILRAIRAGRCRERRYADHIFIQIYFRMHHFVVKFSEKNFASGGKGALTPLTKIVRTFLVSHATQQNNRSSTVLEALSQVFIGAISDRFQLIRPEFKNTRTEPVGRNKETAYCRTRSIQTSLTV